MLITALALLLQVHTQPGSTEGGPPPALADIPNLTVTYYPVAGRDMRTIQRSMKERGPPDPKSGVIYDGRTEVSYSWQAPGRRGGGCDMSAAVFKPEVKVILPRLAQPERLSSADRAEWDEHMTRLIAHERNHVLIGVRGVAETEKQFRAAADCDAAQAAAAAVWTAVAAAQAEYDARTQHGVLEGPAAQRPGKASSRRGRRR